MADTNTRSTLTKLLISFTRWFDSYSVDQTHESDQQQGLDWVRVIPFILLHLACLLVIWVGWSPVALIVAIVLYAVRMFAITGFYHRYFSHRTFKTSRVVQFIFALLGASAIQRGPLWWASHHRHHHAFADQPEDSHSPEQHGFVNSHMGWFLSRDNFHTKQERIRDFSRFPELRLLDRFDILIPVVGGVVLFLTGQWLSANYPGLNTNGAQLLVWGLISTIVLYHVTFTINSLAHRFGSKRYKNKDDSRNNFILALLTFGEGWHNNHHAYPGSARQGFFWWEIDITYYMLKMMEAVGLIHDLKPVPQRILARKDF